MGERAGMEALEPRRLFNGGDIDHSFGDDGFVTLTKGAEISNIFPLENGEILLAGNQPDAGPYVRRLFADGTIDSSFTASGLIPSVRHVLAYGAYALDNRGGLIVAGADHHGVMQVLRVTPSGEIDPHFGINSEERVPLQSIDSVTALPDGRIVVSGIASSDYDPDLSVSSETHGFYVFTAKGRGDNVFGRYLVPTALTSERNDVQFTGTTTLDQERFVALNDGKLLYVNQMNDRATTFDPDNGSSSTSQTWIEAKLFLIKGAHDSSFKFDRTNVLPYQGDVYLDWLEPSPDGGALLIYDVGTPSSDGQSESFQTYSAKFDADGTLHPVAVSEGLEGIVSARDVDGSFFITGESTITRSGSDGTIDNSFQTDPELASSGVMVKALAIADDGGILAAYSRIDEISHDVTSTFIVKLQRTDAPSGLFAGHDLHAARIGGYYFTVKWTDDDGVDFLSLGDNDLYAISPDGIHRSAKLVSTDRSTDAKSITTTYRVTSPSGSWQASDNGTYQIAIRRGTVSDIHGKLAGGRVIGRFKVVIQSIPEAISMAAADTRVESIYQASLVELAGLAE